MSGVRKFLSTSWGIIKNAPVTTAFSVVLIAIGFITHFVIGPEGITNLIATFGFGLPAFEAGEWWTLITGVLFAPEPWMYLTILTPLIFGAGLPPNIAPSIERI